jgi:predicted unusual protein kinase regulating ubiquinone biosynthesis (AarF/ABC1/UbiB family)
MMQPPYGLEDAFRGWTQPACGATTCSGITVTLLRLVAEEHADEVGETDIGDFGMRLGASVGDVPPRLLLVGRAIGLLDGIARQLDPDLNTLEIVARYTPREG